MFTGLIEEIGTISSITQDEKTQQWIVVIHAHVVLKGVKLGDSIALNGVSEHVNRCAVHGQS